MKTKPMKHQEAGRAMLDANPSMFGLGAEQGTGKTWMLLDDMERRFADNFINGVIVLAPKGVHTNWALREIPTHLEAPCRVDYYLSGMGKRRKAAMQKMIDGPQGDKLDILCMNIDALNTKAGYEVMDSFLRNHRASMVLDESSRIKNPKAARTKKVIKLALLAKSRRIASGTMITGGPLDVFSQFEFLSPRRALLGTKSFYAFKSEFAEIVPTESPLVQEIIRRTGKEPQMVARDENGHPIWRNLDKLQKMMSPHVFRVTKAECLDLPDKIYKTIFFELESKQKKVYEQIKEMLRYERDNGDIDKFTALTKITKLRQATSGFIMVDESPVAFEKENNPRLAALKDLVEDIDGKFIVWATFREELRQVAAVLRAAGIETVEYHGGVSTQDREDAVNSFQNGSARAFVGQPQSGGIGLTLTAANTAVYYSNDYSLENRLQSEDRCHRIGTRRPVIYIDLVARGTIDEDVSRALQAKADVANAVLDGL